MKDGRFYKRTLTDYDLPKEAIRRVVEVKRREWAAMQRYVGHQGCRMQFLAGELNDHATEPCGRCDFCSPEGALHAGYEQATGVAAAEFLENVVIEIQPKKLAGRSWADARDRFEEYAFPYRLGELAHEPGRALSYWGEAGWGELVVQWKRAGKLDPQLVTVSAAAIRDRWKPSPAPEWVTFVPSLRKPRLVADFAEALAAALQIPCVDLVRKVTANEPQKTMENAFHQCRNLDGSFAIGEGVRDRPVLLIDDAVDSGWTFAVIAALLRRAGAGAVFPFALASTTPGG